MSLPTLTTERLRLRDVEDKDIQGLFDIHSDPLALKYWAGVPITTMDQAQEILDDIRKINRENSFQWAITLSGQDDLIGTFTLFHIDKKNRRAEVGYILNRKHWRKGYMQEALNRAMTFAFEELKLHRLEADVDPNNLGSLGMLKKAGFQEEGYFYERWYVMNRWCDSVMLGLLKSKWEEARQS